MTERFAAILGPEAIPLTAIEEKGDMEPDPDGLAYRSNGSDGNNEFLSQYLLSERLSLRKVRRHNRNGYPKGTGFRGRYPSAEVLLVDPDEPDPGGVDESAEGISYMPARWVDWKIFRQKHQVYPQPTLALVMPPEVIEMGQYQPWTTRVVSFVRQIIYYPFPT